MKVYVVWHSCYDQVLGVYSTEARAQEVCERITDREEAAGFDCKTYRAEWEAWEVDTAAAGNALDAGASGGGVMESDRCPTCHQVWPERPKCDHCGEPLALRGEICERVCWDKHRPCLQCGECVPVGDTAVICLPPAGPFHRSRDCLERWYVQHQYVDGNWVLVSQEQHG